MTQMVRTQVYIQKRKRAALKRLARARGVSEAELIRQAIDQQLSSNVQPTSSDPKAWEKAHQFMLALHARGPIPNRPRTWKRDDLYEERLELATNVVTDVADGAASATRAAATKFTDKES